MGVCFGITAMDECKLNRNICGHGECMNTQNGFMCHCYPGYQPHPQRKSCVGEYIHVTIHTFCTTNEITDGCTLNLIPAFVVH